MSKKALITGASSGIGKAFAERLAGEGYSLVLVARREERLQELVQSLPGGGHRYLVADLSDERGIDSVCADVAREGYDLLINNAGFGVYGRFDEIDVDKLKQMSRLNCDAVVALAHVFLKGSKRGDALINVASTVGFLPLPSNAVYAATKAFVTSLSEALWYEHRNRGVFVTALCPGATKTEFFDIATGDRAAGGDRAAKRGNSAAEGNRGQPPEAIFQTSEQVVQAAMKALRKRRAPVVVSGMQNELMVFSSRLMPRKMIVHMMGTISGALDR